jgi:hypothetical protein
LASASPTLRPDVRPADEQRGEHHDGAQPLLDIVAQLVLAPDLMVGFGDGRRRRRDDAARAGPQPDCLST